MSSDRLRRVLRALGRALLSNVAVVAAIAVAYIQIRDWWYARPQLEVAIQEITFESEQLKAGIVGRLKDINVENGAITGFRLNRLQQHWERVDWDDADRIENFARALHREIKFYDAKIDYRLTPEDICYRNGVILWQDCQRVDLGGVGPLEKGKECERLFDDLERRRDELSGSEAGATADVRPECEFFDLRDTSEAGELAFVIFPHDFVEAIREDPSALDAKDTDAVRRIAWTLYHFDKDPRDEERRHKVAQSLRGVRDDVARLAQRRGDVLIVTLSVENRSRAPNFLSEGALLRVCRRPVECKELDLSIRGERQIEGSAIRSVTLASHALDPYLHEVLREAIRSRHPAVVAIRDVNGEVYPGVYPATGREALVTKAREAL